MAVTQAALNTLNTNIDTVKAGLAAVLAGLAADEELVWTSDTDDETESYPGPRRIVIEDESGLLPAQAIGNNLQQIKNMQGIINAGAFSSSDAT